MPLIRFRRIFPRTIFLWTRQTKEPITSVFFQQLQPGFSLQIYGYVGGWNKVCIYTLYPRQCLETNRSVHSATNEAPCNCLKSQLLYEFPLNATFFIKYKRIFNVCFSEKLNIPRKIFLTTGSPYLNGNVNCLFSLFTYREFTGS